MLTVEPHGGLSARMSRGCLPVGRVVWAAVFLRASGKSQNGVGALTVGAQASCEDWVVFYIKMLENVRVSRFRVDGVGKKSGEQFYRRTGRGGCLVHVALMLALQTCDRCTRLGPLVLALQEEEWAAQQERKCCLGEVFRQSPLGAKAGGSSAQQWSDWSVSHVQDRVWFLLSSVFFQGKMNCRLRSIIGGAGDFGGWRGRTSW